MDLNNVKAGVGLIGVKGQAPIIPIKIDSNYKLFSKVLVKIGKPITLEKYYKIKLSVEDYKEISKDILKSIYILTDE